MQPCAVCGAVTLNTAGYCTQCGTFRGAPPQSPYGPPPPQYPGQAPISGPGYGPPTSGAIGFPTSGPPGGYPTSGGPYAPPSSGGGYPTAYPPPPGAGSGGKAKPFVVPLVALSVVLVLVVVAIVVVVLVRNSDDSGGGTAGPTTPAPDATSAAPASNVDPCVVGRWRVTSHEEVVPIEDVGKTTFTGGDGVEMEFKADGSAVTDFGSSTAYEATVRGTTLRLEVKGTLNFEFTARDGTMSYKNFDSDATAQWYRNGQAYGTEGSFNGDDDPSNYSCDSDSLTQKTSIYETKLEKVG